MNVFERENEKKKDNMWGKGGLGIMYKPSCVTWSVMEWAPPHAILCYVYNIVPQTAVLGREKRR